MRNLRNLRHTAIKFGEDEDALTAVEWEGDGVICSFGPSHSSPTITLKRFAADAYEPGQATAVASWDAPSPNPDLAVDKILDLHCFPDTGTICLVLAGGDIYVVREDASPDEELIEIVGSVDTGIAAVAWSPEEELLLIASKADTLLFMTREFEGIASISLSVHDLKVSNHVSVGWGKRETQFQGRGAKALRDPTVPEHVDEGKLSPFDDGRCTISWRGDGQYVAVNSVLDTEPKRRVIRVYSREGTLDSVSEPVDGLEGALSWKPSGQLIAGIQRGDDRIDVVFFERNGLRHGEFSLRLCKDDMQTFGTSIGLDWNNDSSVLAVSMKDRIQLWTMGNYHYYLKQELVIDRKIDDSLSSVWHAEKALHVACFTERCLRVLEHTFEVTRGSTVPPQDLGLVAVVDGRNLKVTPMRTANVPPPMALEEIELRENAIDVAINRAGTQMAVLHGDSVSVWDCRYNSRPFKPARLEQHLPLGTALLSQDDSVFIARQIKFSGDGEIVIAGSVANAPGTQIQHPHAEIISRSSKGGLQGSLLFCDTNHEDIFHQDHKGAIHKVTHNVNDQAMQAKLPARCVAIEAWRQSDSLILFGLTAGGTLHIQSETQSLKIQGCTSFVVTQIHLIYTTSSHLLKFVHLHDGELQVPPDEPEKDERCRNIERGAKLVTVMPSAYSLVLQMPRGNLETIFPRALVLAGIRAAIGSRDYKKAFLICRTQRVDMNILHDYVPEQFIRDIKTFVEQVEKVEYIDLFLSSLSAEDVSQTIYQETAKPLDDKNTTNGLVDGDVKHATQSNAPSKVNRICDAFLTVLNGQEATYLQSIVTAHVCKDPPDLEAGLSLVAELRKQKKQVQLDQAVEHICFLADVNRLFDTALGIYDLDVALLVAQQSQKDPREYLPYLQKLHDLPTLRQRHAIDTDLKRYPKALTHLHALGDFEEVKAYAIKHELYSTAIDLYRYDNGRLTELMRIYADFLSSRNRYKEAGIAFEYIGDYIAAYESYRSCTMWRECLSCAALANLPDEKLSELARHLAENEEEAKNYNAAATIHLEHLQDLPTAARLLCRGYHFSNAIRHIATRKALPLLREVIDPGLIEASATTTEMLAEMRTQLQNQVPRLRELRQKKAEDPMAFLDNGVDAADDAPDNISLAPTDTTTGGTFMTRYTNRSAGTLATNATRKTSKNRRREERKRARGKKGTVYEEEYLVNSIARLIERLNSVGEDVGRLVEGLMRRGMRERAVAVEGAMVEVVDACKACTAEVFARQSEGEPRQDGIGDAARPWGGQGVLWEAMEASQQIREAPVLKDFDKLVLLQK